MKKILILFFAVAMLWACGDKKTSPATETTASTPAETTEQQPETSAPADTVKPEKPQPEVLKVKTKTGKYFVITPAEGKAEPEYSVSGEGFARPFSPYKIKPAAAIKEALTADLDGNGFDEVYLISDAGLVAAFASYRDKSMGEIAIKAVPSKGAEVKVYLSGGRLFAEWQTPAGESVKFEYRLKEGEAGYRLVPVKR